MPRLPTSCRQLDRPRDAIRQFATPSVLLTRSRKILGTRANDHVGADCGHDDLRYFLGVGDHDNVH